MTARFRMLAATLGAALLVPCVPAARGQAPAPDKTQTPPATQQPAAAAKPAPAPPRRFGSAEEATQALVAAVRAGNVDEMVRILGRDGRALVSSGDPVADRQARERFLEAYDAANKLVADGGTTVLHVGQDDWPFPIPLVKQGDRWQFDVRRGRDEILARRIGRNEIYTIETCLAYVDAQREYYAVDHKGDGILQYAKQFVSTSGARDGLYWLTQPGEPPSPLGELVARARAEGYRAVANKPTPYHGYLYRILTAQGPSAPGGAYDYLVRGHMIAGFGLIAFPAEYGVSGVMTFIVNHDGVVYQKDLGPRTRELALATKTFAPDRTWTKAEAPQVAAPRD